MRKSACIIVNPASGRGAAFQKAKVARHLLQKMGVDVVWRPTESSNHGRQIALNNASDVEVLISVGGDGTLNEVVNGVIDADSDTPVSIIPSGTANVVARELGIPLTVESQVKTGIFGQVRTLDLGSVEKRRFIMGAGAGFDGQIVDIISRTRTDAGITMLHYVKPILQQIHKYNYPKIRVFIDDKLVDTESSCTIIGNVSFYGGRLRLFKDASPEDGLLDVCCIHADGPMDLLRCFIGILKPDFKKKDAVKFFRGKRIFLDASEDVLVQIDGDQGGKLPMSFSIIPKAVSFCV